jgi:hypothetical protein
MIRAVATPGLRVPSMLAVDDASLLMEINEDGFKE